MTESFNRKLGRLAQNVSGTGTITSNAATASAWQTARTITLGGDLSGSVSIDGSSNVSLTATVSGDAVVLGTDTTGNYVATIAAGSGISVAGSGSETAAVTVSIDNTVATLTGEQTLTNKTLTTPVISSITNTGTLTLPTSTDTLVGRATSDTLTNKTISGSNNTISNIGNGSLTNSSITVNGTSIALGASGTLVTDDISEDGTPVNLWFTNTRARGAVSATDAGGDGSFSYDSGTGVFTYTGPSATEVRSHFTAGTGLTYTTGQFAIDSTVATLTGSQTLTNKTISGADNTLSNIGNNSLTNSSITINGGSVSLGGTRTLVTDDIAEDGSPVNLWYTDTRSRAAISVTDSGGDGSLSYNSGSGVITYTGPSAAEVRAHFSAGTGVAISSGQISIGQAVATTDNVTFAGVTADNIRVGVTGANEIDTSSGNLTIDSTGGTTVMDDDVNVTGNLLVDGNLTVSGTTVTVNTTNLAVEDNMIYLNNGSAVTNPDLGFAGNYNDGTYRHAGVFRDASDGVWKFFHQYTPEPDASAYIDITHGSFALAPVQASSFTGSLTGNVTGNASTATAWATGRTLTLSGDVTGTSAAFDGSGNISITTTIAANSVALGTDTTGDYVASVAVAGTGLSVAGSGENATYTITSNATSANTGSTIVARDASGNFTAGTITAALSGNATTATNISGYSGTYWTSNNDGTGSGLDADLVDGLQASSFMRSAGTENNGTIIIRDNRSTTNYYNTVALEIRSSDQKAVIGLHRDGYSHVGIAHEVSNQLRFNFNSGDVYINSSAGTLWGSGNDGASSGLDADLLDGQQGAYYAAASSLSSYLPLSGGMITGNLGVQTGYFQLVTGSILASNASTRGFIVDGNYTNGQFRHRWRKYDDGNGIPLYLDYAHATADSYTAIARFGGGGTYRELDVYGTFSATTVLQGTNQVLHAGNYTSYVNYGNPSTRGTYQISNWNQTTYPNSHFLSSEDGVSNAPTSDFTYGLQYAFHRDGASYRTQMVTSLYSNPTALWVRNSRDGDVWTSWSQILHTGNYNSYSPTLTGTGASGTWGISITGNAATATSATTASQLGGVAAANYFRTDGTYPNTDMNTVVEGYWHIASGSSNIPINYYGHRWDYDHLQNGQWVVQMYSPTSSDASIWHRQIRNYVAQPWRNILDSSNYNSYSPTLTGTGASGTWGININGVINTTVAGGSVLIKHSVSEVDAWIFQENAANWGLYYKNNPSGQHTFGGYTSVGAETVGMSAANVSGNGVQTSNYVGATSAYAQFMLSHYTGYIWSASTVYAATSMVVGGNLVLHAGNYSSYALPLSGGTMTGSITFSAAGFVRFGHSNESDSNDGKIGASLFASGLNIVGTRTVVAEGRVVRVWGSMITDAGQPYLHSGNYSSYALPLSGGTLSGQLNANAKRTNFGASSGWDGVGFSNLTNVHMQGHDHFWIGAGNAYWYRGGINTEHDLLITTMYGYDSTAYYRGITFGVENNGTGGSGNYRLGRWQTYGTGWNTTRLQVDASLSVGYGARGTQSELYLYDASQYPLDSGVWPHGVNETQYGSRRGYIFSPSANGGGPWASFASAEVSTQYIAGVGDIPALFRIHQWGSGSAEFWKPNGTVLYLRESPVSGALKHGNWFTKFTVQRTIESDTEMRAPIFKDTDNDAYFLNLAGDGTQAANINGNIRINPKSETWAEGISFNMPTQATWGGLRWVRSYSGSFTGNWALGYPGTESSNDMVWWSGDNSVKWRLDHSGNTTSSGNVTAYSDIRLKKNIERIANALDKVCKINGYTFERTDVQTPMRQAGVIAQEVLEVLPEVVLGSEETQYSVAYGNMVGLLIEAIKEQQQEIKDLKKEIKIMKGEN